MKPRVRIILYGSLRNQTDADSEGCVHLELEEETNLTDILQRIRIKPDRVQMCMRNHKAVGREVTVRPGDRIGLFPKEYAIFVDWLEYRNRP